MREDAASDASEPLCDGRGEPPPTCGNRLKLAFLPLFSRLMLALLNGGAELCDSLLAAHAGSGATPRPGLVNLCIDRRARSLVTFVPAYSAAALSLLSG